VNESDRAAKDLAKINEVNDKHRDISLDRTEIESQHQKKLKLNEICEMNR
jgi:hypothetical protein